MRAHPQIQLLVRLVALRRPVHRDDLGLGLLDGALLLDSSDNSGGVAGIPSTSSLSRLTWCRRRKIVFLVVPSIVNRIHLAEWCAPCAVGRGGDAILARTTSSLLDRTVGSLGYTLGRVGSHLLAELPLDALLEPPFPEDTLVQVKPVLLGANDHARTHEAHVGDDLVGGEAISVNEVGTNQAASATETSLAMNSNALLPDRDHLVSQANEFAHSGKRWAGAVLEDHVDVLDAKSLKVRGIVENRVEANHESDIPLGKVCQDIAKGLVDKGVRLDLGKVLWKQLPTFRAFWRLGHLGGLWGSKSKEAGRDPVEIAVLDPLKLFVFVEIKVLKNAAALLLGLPHTINDILDSDAIVGLTIAGISERHEGGVNLRNRREGQMWWP